MLEMWILERVANETNADHGMKNGGKSTGRDVGLVVPLEKPHEVATIDRHPFSELFRHLGDFCFAAHRFFGVGMSRLRGKRRDVEL